MSNTQNPTKPFTANFELQTKIRTIIQQVLAATIRKLSVFNEKIDKFEDYFMVYKEKIQTLQKNCHQNRQAIHTEYEQRLKNKKEFTTQVIKSHQVQQGNLIKFDQIQSQVNQISKTIKLCQRQNQNLSSELSKTKGRFMEYSNVISALKEQVSWKITKYIEETADTNTAIKINNEAMKKEYFNVMLMLQKQKEKYDKIIEMNQNNQNNTKKMVEGIQRLQTYNTERIDENKRTLQKLDEYDTILQSKLKTLDNKCQLRISQLQKDNKKSMGAVKKLQIFNQKIQEIQQQVQRNSRQLIKKIQQINKKSKDQTQLQIVKLSKQLLKIQKNLEKKLSQLQQSTQKAQDFLTQKIEFMKMEMESQISSHTNQLMKEKQDSGKVNSSTMDQINQKINKFNLQIQKNISKLQTFVKQTKSQLKKDLNNFAQSIESKLQNIESTPKRKLSDDQGGKKISPELIKQIEQFSTKINQVQQRLNKKDLQIQQIKQNEGKTQLFQKEMVRNIDTYFKQQQEGISNKVEKIMFLVTKMRGDNIVRNQFIEKEIKQIKKNHSEYKSYTDTILKLTPAFGQCINLILSLIYDAEFQHSKIIQDNLPLLKKDEEKFNTCVQGVLYEFKEKKKPGMICYRHKDIKKTDIVKATFNGYIKVWEGLFENEYKNKAQYLPKDFYKKAVQKAVNTNKVSVQKTQRVQRPQKRQNSLSLGKQSNFYEKMANTTGYSRPIYDNSQRRQHSQKQEQKMTQSQSNNGLPSMNHMASRDAVTSLKKIQQEQRSKQIKETINSKEGLQKGDNNMNSSFHIRKKKTVKKDQVMVVNIASLGS